MLFEKLENINSKLKPYEVLEEKGEKKKRE